MTQGTQVCHFHNFIEMLSSYISAIVAATHMWHLATDILGSTIAPAFIGGFWHFESELYPKHVTVLHKCVGVLR